MFIKLECSECGAASQVSYYELCTIWKQGYAQAPPARRKRAKAVTEIKCYCGHQDRYDAPMMDWVFQTIFDEFVKETAAV